MRATSILYRSRALPRDTGVHRFAVGQTVRLKGRFGRSVSAADVYHITGTLPPRGDSPQYRIRNDDERYERVATQDSIEPIDLSRTGTGATLIERTFGHGQRTETQQPRDQEAKAGKGSAQA